MSFGTQNFRPMYRLEHLRLLRTLFAEQPKQNTSPPILMRELGDTTTFILRFFFSCSGLPRYAGRFARGPSRRLSHRTRGYMERHQPHTGAFPVYPFYKPLSCCRHDGIHDHAAMYSVIITASRSWPGTASASPSGMSKNILPVFAGDTDTYPCILPLS